MAWLTWTLVGVGLVAVILVLGLRINRKKRAARMAVRLAEVYRVHGAFDVAEQLYRVPFDLDQNRETAIEGLERLEAGDTSPVMEADLVEDAERMLRKGREHLEAVLVKRGVDVELPPLEPSEGEAA